jgi:hypothetical protein
MANSLTDLHYTGWFKINSYDPSGYYIQGDLNWFVCPVKLLHGDLKLVYGLCQAAILHRVMEN